jgi:hypothetical protein
MNPKEQAAYDLVKLVGAMNKAWPGLNADVDAAIVALLADLAAIPDAAAAPGPGATGAAAKR